MDPWRPFGYATETSVSGVAQRPSFPFPFPLLSLPSHYPSLSMGRALPLKRGAS